MRAYGQENVSREYWRTDYYANLIILVSFGSEMAWDSTGQEGVYAWAKYFNDSTTAQNVINSIIAYQPTIPHWGYNGNARRYWYVCIPSPTSASPH